MYVKRKSQAVASITLGYSDSEDRLWCRLILKNKNEAQFWMTRNLCFKFCKNVWKFLKIHSPLTSDNFQKLTIEKASTLIPEKSPPPPEKKQVISGLCISISIDYKDIYIIKFLTNSQTQYILHLSPEATCRLMNIFTKASFNANWHLPVSWPHT
jgi:hypothetical protein